MRCIAYPPNVRWIALGAGALAVCIAAGSAAAQTTTCARSDFEAVVGQASNTLRDMTARNTPTFQSKLRELKDKRGWSYQQFVTEAAPFVADDKIAEFDSKSVEYLTRINSMGGEAASGSTPDCKLLDTLRAIMGELVETQTGKWTYMFGKLDAEIAK